MKQKNIAIFILFLIVSLGDATLTYLGLANGILEEANIFINYLIILLNINIYFSIALVKFVSIILVYWILFVLPERLKEESIRERIIWKIWLREDIPWKVTLVLIIVTAVFGLIPGLIINLRL